MNASSFRDVGISIEPGQKRTTCPVCSPHRHKAHDPCLSVDQERGVWFCHHCGFTGSLQHYKKPQQFVPKAKLTQPVALPIFTDGVLDADSLAYVHSRGISTHTLRALRIKSAPVYMATEQGTKKLNCLHFPFFFKGAVVNVKYRTLDKRFRQEKNALKCFYNYDLAMQALKNGEKRLIITEGEFDALACFEAGFTAVVSVPDGAPAVNAKAFHSKFDFLDTCKDLLDAADMIVLALDNDEPGRKLEDVLAMRLGKERCLRASWPEKCKDANDVLIQYGKACLADCITNAAPCHMPGLVDVHSLWNAVLDLHDNPQQVGLPMGWAPYDRLFNLEQGQLTVITGIPSHGKSSFVALSFLNSFFYLPV